MNTGIAQLLWEKKSGQYNYIAVLYMCYVNHPLISIWNPQIHPELRL